MHATMAHPATTLQSCRVAKPFAAICKIPSASVSIAVEMATGTTQIAFVRHPFISGVVENLFSGENIRRKFFNRDNICFTERRDDRRQSCCELADIECA